MQEWTAKSILQSSWLVNEIGRQNGKKSFPKLLRTCYHICGHYYENSQTLPIMSLKKSVPHFSYTP